MTAQPGATCPHEAYYIYWMQQLQAIRMGKWKMHFDHDYWHPDPPGADGKPGKNIALHIGFELFDLQADESEKTGRQRRDGFFRRGDLCCVQARRLICRASMSDANRK